MMTELVHNRSLEEVTTVIANACWVFAIDACVNANVTQLYKNSNLNELRHLKITLIVPSRNWIVRDSTGFSFAKMRCSIGFPRWRTAQSRARVERRSIESRR